MAGQLNAAGRLVPLGAQALGTLQDLASMQHQNFAEQEAFKTLQQALLHPSTLSSSQAGAVGMALVWVQKALEAGVAHTQCLSLIEGLVGPALLAPGHTPPHAAVAAAAAVHALPTASNQLAAKIPATTLLQKQLRMLEASLGHPVTLPLECHVRVKVDGQLLPDFLAQRVHVEVQPPGDRLGFTNLSRTSLPITDAGQLRDAGLEPWPHEPNTLVWRLQSAATPAAPATGAAAQATTADAAGKLRQPQQVEISSQAPPAKRPRLSQLVTAPGPAPSALPQQQVPGVGGLRGPAGLVGQASFSGQAPATHIQFTSYSAGPPVVILPEATTPPSLAQAFFATGKDIAIPTQPALGTAKAPTTPAGQKKAASGSYISSPLLRASSNSGLQHPMPSAGTGGAGHDDVGIVQLAPAITLSDAHLLFPGQLPTKEQPLVTDLVHEVDGQRCGEVQRGVEIRLRTKGHPYLANYSISQLPQGVRHAGWRRLDERTILRELRMHGQQAPSQQQPPPQQQQHQQQARQAAKAHASKAADLAAFRAISRQDMEGLFGPGGLPAEGTAVPVQLVVWVGQRRVPGVVTGCSIAWDGEQGWLHGRLTGVPYQTISPVGWRWAEGGSAPEQAGAGGAHSATRPAPGTPGEASASLPIRTIERLCELKSDKLQREEEDQTKAACPALKGSIKSSDVEALFGGKLPTNEQPLVTDLVHEVDGERCGEVQRGLEVRLSRRGHPYLTGYSLKGLPTGVCHVGWQRLDEHTLVWQLSNQEQPRPKPQHRKQQQQQGGEEGEQRRRQERDEDGKAEGRGEEAPEEGEEEGEVKLQGAGWSAHTALSLFRRIGKKSMQALFGSDQLPAAGSSVPVTLVVRVGGQLLPGVYPGCSIVPSGQRWRVKGRLPGLSIQKLRPLAWRWAEPAASGAGGPAANSSAPQHVPRMLERVCEEREPHAGEEEEAQPLQMAACFALAGAEGEGGAAGSMGGRGLTLGAAAAAATAESGAQAAALGHAGPAAEKPTWVAVNFANSIYSGTVQALFAGQLPTPEQPLVTDLVHEVDGQQWGRVQREVEVRQGVSGLHLARYSRKDLPPGVRHVGWRRKDERTIVRELSSQTLTAQEVPKGQLQQQGWEQGREQGGMKGREKGQKHEQEEQGQGQEQARQAFKSLTKPSMQALFGPGGMPAAGSSVPVTLVVRVGGQLLPGVYPGCSIVQYGCQWNLRGKLPGIPFRDLKPITWRWADGDSAAGAGGSGSQGGPRVLERVCERRVHAAGAEALGSQEHGAAAAGLDACDTKVTGDQEHDRGQEVEEGVEEEGSDEEGQWVGDEAEEEGK